MLNSRHISNGRRQGKEPEQSNFVQTCNLLSQYVKKKGSLKDLNLEIGGKVESLEAIVNPRSRYAASAPAATSSLSNMEKSAQPSTEEQSSIDPFPRLPKPNSSIDINVEYVSNSTSKEAVATAEPKTAQLTMFYGGRVLVFDDYPADKAKELVALAKKGSSQMSHGIFSNTLQEKPNSSCAMPATSSGLPPRPQANCSHKHVVISSNTCKEQAKPATSGTVASSSKTEEPVSPHNETNGSDLPIARRSSLHRFLEKRKDRAGGRGPYQIQEQPASSSSKGDEQLELKL